MKQSWYDEIHQILYKAITVKLPLEIVHFPSTGVTSAISRFAEDTKNNDEAQIKCFIIDLRSSQFGTNLVENKIEFTRFVKASMEQYLDKNSPDVNEGNFYRSLEEIFKHYISNKKKVLICIHTNQPIDTKLVPEYKDFLMFLDHLRDTSNGYVNLVIASIIPQFCKGNISPIPMITQYFNYYRPAWVNRSINEDLLNNSPFKKHSVEDVMKLVELSGGLPSIVKGLLRDLTLFDQKLNEIYKLNLNQEFFDNYLSTRIVFDRMVEQLPLAVTTTIRNIINGEAIELQDSNIVEYLKKVSLLDDANRIRGMIMQSYFKTYYKPESAAVVPVEMSTNILNTESQIEDQNLLKINHKLTVNQASGEILMNNIPSEEYLTEKELKAFRCLFDNANHDVKREDLANIIWKDESNFEYSDWAIDKIISRIREKIGDTKPYKIIKTARNKGFSMII
jgi:DNA-binding winged helix-turn-helix (wHTH) protein